jgi:hypothetical protein
MLCPVVAKNVTKKLVVHVGVNSNRKFPRESSVPLSPV